MAGIPTQFSNVTVPTKANVYFDAMQPWATRKTDLARTATTLYIACQVVKALAYAMAPFLPEGAAKLAETLGLNLGGNGPDGGPDIWSEAVAPLAPGAPIAPPQVLFPKLDKDRIAELAEAHLRGEAT